MSNIDKQAVQAVADLKAGYTLGHADVEIIQQMDLDAVTLLDELEAKDNRINRLEAIVAVAEHRNALMREWKRALKVPCDLVDDQVPVVIHGMVIRLERLKETEDKLTAAEKRIAELERNEIREEGNQFLVVRYPGKLPVVKHCAGELEGFLRQLLEHDPMATIDIVTHRYYGVGGQWVQDADEYLQMMAAAAGKGEAS
ncbi:ead/Ea22-like family protein [Enterobacter hormaechei]